MLSVLRIALEFVSSFIKLKVIGGVSGTVLFFGSARIKSQEENKESKISKYYDDTCHISYEVSKWIKEQKLENKYLIASGGGPGIMEAANKGAYNAKLKNIGFNIKLPFEQKHNKYITPSLSFDYQYFFCRKYWMLKTAKVIVICPGGFGTLDELFETLTLIQTQKVKRKIPIIFYDAEFYKDLISFINQLADHTLICEEDKKLYEIVNSKEQAIEVIKKALSANA